MLRLSLFVSLLCLALAVDVPTVTYLPATPPTTTHHDAISPAETIYFYYTVTPPVLAAPLAYLRVTVVPDTGDNPNFNVSVATCGLPDVEIFNTLELNLVQFDFHPNENSRRCVSDSSQGCEIDSIYFCLPPDPTPTQVYIAISGFEGTGFTLTIEEVPILSMEPFASLGITEVTLDSEGLAFLPDEFAASVGNVINGTIYAINTSAIPSTAPKIISFTSYTTTPTSTETSLFTGFAFGDGGNNECKIYSSSFGSFGGFSVAPGCQMDEDTSIPLPNPLYFVVTTQTYPSPMQLTVWIPPTAPSLIALTPGTESSSSVNIGQVVYFSIPNTPGDLTVTVTPDASTNASILTWVASGIEYPGLPCYFDRDQCNGNSSTICEMQVSGCRIEFQSGELAKRAEADPFGIRVAVKGLFSADGGVNPAASVSFTILAEFDAEVFDTPIPLSLTVEHELHLAPNVWHDFVFSDIEDLFVSEFSFVREPNTTSFGGADRMQVIVSGGQPFHSTNSCPTQNYDQSGSGIDTDGEFSSIFPCIFDEVVNSTDLYVSVFFTNAEGPNATDVAFNFNLRVLTRSPTALTVGSSLNNQVYNTSATPNYYIVNNVAGGTFTATISTPGLTSETIDQFFNSDSLDFSIGACGNVESDFESPDNKTVVYTLTLPFAGTLCRHEIRIFLLPQDTVTFNIRVDLVDEVPNFTPGDPPITFSFGTHFGSSEQAALSFDVAGATAAGESIIVQARGQSSTPGNHPYSLELSSPGCENFLTNCPGDAQPCFVTIPFEQWGATGRWYLEIVSPENGAEAVWVNVSLGQDNCQTVYPSSALNFCADQQIQTENVFLGFAGLEYIDYLPELVQNTIDALPDASTECVAAIKRALCQSAYRTCDADAWVPLDGTLCLACQDFVDKCSDLGTCATFELACAETCDVNGSSGSLPATGTSGGDGSSASSLRASLIF